MKWKNEVQITRNSPKKSSKNSKKQFSMQKFTIIPENAKFFNHLIHNQQSNKIPFHIHFIKPSNFNN